MSTQFAQEHRTIEITTPLGKDTLLLRSFSGSEEISRPFLYDLDLMSTDAEIEADQIVGKNVTFWVLYTDESPRYFNGYVSRFSGAGHGDRLHLYRAQVVPWLWFLTRKSDCRIFQNKKIPDIIKEVFTDLGFNDFRIECKGDHPEWVYCVQYRETDFNFVSRLMEHEGIFYFFEHDNGKHTMVITDSTSSYKECKEQDAQINRNLSDVLLSDQIYRWDHHFQYTSGKWAQQDYNFETATTDLKTQTNSIVHLDNNDKYEYYDYPGEYEKKPQGEDDTKYRMEEEEGGWDTVHGESFCRSFNPGFKFKVKDDGDDDGKKFVSVSVRHTASVGGGYVTNESADSGGYGNNFVVIPDDLKFRPARLTPKPHISGIQTALVVGPKGEEIYTDKYGRIKVQFYWDRYGKKDENSSCWIRCAQGSAGRKWGAMFIPRIGQEVVVEFLEGDPDRPLITGVVYNSDQMPAYELPAEMTKSWIKTDTSKGGDGFNELRFEDKKDQEQIFIHAERNMDVRIKNDEMETVINDRHLIVGTEDKEGNTSGDQKEKVFKDKHLHVLGDHTEQIEGNMQLKIGTDASEDGGKLDIVTTGDRKIRIQGNDNLTVYKDRRVGILGKLSLTTGSDKQEAIGGSWALTAVEEISLSGVDIVIEAAESISLQAPGGFITIDDEGVAINGIMVTINSGGMPGIGSPADPDEPDDADDADPSDPKEADDAKTGQKSCNS